MVDNERGSVRLQEHFPKNNFLNELELIRNQLNTHLPLSANSAVHSSTAKNFKEDEHRNSLINKFKDDMNDIKSEISDGKRMDLDEDIENYVDYHNKIKKDPQHKQFNFFYEIQLYGQYDFIFDFKGEMSKAEFMNKTEKIRELPYHLKYTLFSTEEIKKLRQKEFAFIYFHFDEMKEKGNKMYKRGKFREAIDFYIAAYSLLKWIEFKDPQSKNFTKLLREQTPILDEDIKEGKCSKLNWMTNALEEDSYRFCMINLLLSLSYAYMELRHYSSAIHCLDECLTYDDSVPDVYFRRAQARIYNKFSDLNSLIVALADIQRAMSLNNCRIFFEHNDIVNNLIHRKKNLEIEKLKNFFVDSYSSYLKNKNNMKLILERNINDIYQHTQYKVMKEMKLKYKVAVKFYTETKNEEQLNYAFKEIESFTEIYNNFKWYYKFNLENIKNKNGYLIIEDLDLESEIDMELYKGYKSDFVNFLDRYKLKIADSIFQQGSFNMDLVKYAIDKVLKKEKKINEEIDINSLLNNAQLNSGSGINCKLFPITERTSSNLSLFFSFSLAVLSLALIFTHYYMYMKNPLKFFKGINE